jgi:hypothetical protein
LFQPLNAYNGAFPPVGESLYGYGANQGLPANIVTKSTRTVGNGIEAAASLNLDPNRPASAPLGLPGVQGSTYTPLIAATAWALAYFGSDQTDGYVTLRWNVTWMTELIATYNLENGTALSISELGIGDQAAGMGQTEIRISITNSATGLNVFNWITQAEPWFTAGLLWTAIVGSTGTAQRELMNALAQCIIPSEMRVNITAGVYYSPMQYFGAAFVGQNYLIRMP